MTFYSTEFRDTLPEGSKLFSVGKIGDTVIQETFTTPDGQKVSTGVQSDGIQFAPSQETSSGGNQGGGNPNEGGGGTIVVGNQTVQTPGSSYEYDSSGRKGFTYGLQEGGPVDMPMANQPNVKDADNLELVNEPQKDKTGVADDVPRSLDDGDFVINAPAVKIAVISAHKSAEWRCVWEWTEFCNCLWAENLLRQQTAFPTLAAPACATRSP